MQNCTFLSSRLAAIAMGGYTAINAEQTTLSGCEDGMVAANGASVTLHGGTFAVSRGSAAVARDVGRVCLHECTLQSCPQADVEHQLYRVAALEARKGGVLDATACYVAVGATGVAARDSGSAATIRGCSLSNMSAYGALAHDGGRVTGGLPQEAARGSVATAREAPAQAQAGHTLRGEFACTAEQCRFGYVASGTGAVLRLVRCLAEGCKRSGVRVQAGASAEMHKCRLACSQESNGLVVQGVGSRVAATGCTTDGNAQAGVYVYDGARAELHESVLSGNSLDGLAVQGKGSEAHAQACHFRNNKRHGFRVYGAGDGEGEGCTSIGNGGAGYQVRCKACFG
jgi:Right handed beta helix region